VWARMHAPFATLRQQIRPILTKPELPSYLFELYKIAPSSLSHKPQITFAPCLSPIVRPHSNLHVSSARIPITAALGRSNTDSEGLSGYSPTARNPNLHNRLHIITVLRIFPPLRLVQESPQTVRYTNMGTGKKLSHLWHTPLCVVLLRPRLPDQEQ